METLGTNDRFYWGAATAAYQIEGSPMADGAGMCVWHEFSHTPGNTVDGDTGDVAADHYRRWAADVDMMKGLGLNAYRFSLRWARVLPEGKGRVNQGGIDFYSRLVDKLLASGIEPFVTLFHWDTPSGLHRLGGWTNPDIAGWFADYASVVAGALGDRVTHWMTLNEPFVVAEQGHLYANHAPGMRNIYATCACVHHQIRAHVAGYHAIKALSSQASVGMAMHNLGAWPATGSPEDVAAAERAHCWHNFPLFADPLVHGHYPQAIEDRLAPYLPKGYEDDMASLKVAPDFMGLNYYTTHLVKHSASTWLGTEVVPEPDVPRMAMLDWVVRPQGLYQLITQAHDRYRLPALYVTENGAAYHDAVVDGAVHDVERTEYLKSHTAAVLQAKEEGAPVQGYFVWSLMDNFEWGLGYSMRFGIVRVDYATQERTVKDSGQWYSRLARSGATTVSGTPA